MKTKQLPGCKDDDDLIKLCNEKMRFVHDPERLSDKMAQLELIRYFEEAYANTDQDTVLYAPEFVLVVRSIMNAHRPVKLFYLTDFEGEER